MKKTLNVSGTKRRLLQHINTLFAAAMAILLTCLIVPGQSSISSSYAGTWHTYYHGWPSDFLVRHVDSDIGIATSEIWTYAPPWRKISAWRFWDGEHDRFSWLMLILDTAVGSLVVITATFLFHLVWKKLIVRRRLYLRDAAVVVTLCCVLVAWLASESNGAQLDRYASESLRRRGHFVDVSFCGPSWIPRLTGFQPSIFDRAAWVGLENCDDDEFQRSMLDVVNLRRVTSIEIRSQSLKVINAQALNALQRMPRLKELDVSDTVLKQGNLERIREVLVGVRITSSDEDQ